MWYCTASSTSISHITPLTKDLCFLNTQRKKSYAGVTMSRHITPCTDTPGHTCSAHRLLQYAFFGDALYPWSHWCSPSRATGRWAQCPTYPTPLVFHMVPRARTKGTHNCAFSLLIIVLVRFPFLWQSNSCHRKGRLIRLTTWMASPISSQNLIKIAFVFFFTECIISAYKWFFTSAPHFKPVLFCI